MEMCEVCKNEQRICALEKDSERNSNQHREFYEVIKQSTVKQAVTDNNYSQILTTLARLEAKVDEMELKPAKKWDKVVMSVITAVIGVVIGILANR